MPKNNLNNFVNSSTTAEELAIIKKTVSEEAKALVVAAFRNGPIENVHNGKQCPTCAGNPEYSHITQDEMKAIMKYAVNHLYTLRLLHLTRTNLYARYMSWIARHDASQWDAPEEVDLSFLEKESFN